jgi:polyribonucleotide nucleotidyltransferase
MEILDHMEQTIPAVRPELSPYAPKVKMMHINPDKIRDVIGAGGKVITEIIEQCDNVKIDIEQDGRVFIMHQDYAPINKAMELINNIIREAEVGKIYEAKVVRIEKFGCFVQIWEGCEGLVHISKLAKERVEKVEDVLNVGDEILVKVIELGKEDGKFSLSAKDAMKV